MLTVGCTMLCDRQWSASSTSSRTIRDESVILVGQKPPTPHHLGPRLGTERRPAPRSPPQHLVEMSIIGGVSTAARLARRARLCARESYACRVGRAGIPLKRRLREEHAIIESRGPTPQPISTGRAVAGTSDPAKLPKRAKSFTKVPRDLYNVSISCIHID